MLQPLIIRFDTKKHPKEPALPVIDSSKPWVLLDRDGVLLDVVIRGGSEVSSARGWDEVRIKNDISLNDWCEFGSNMNLAVVSNQPDISRGLITESFLYKVSRNIFLRTGISVFYYCPHQRSDKCSCRKPSCEMGKALMREFDVDHKRLLGMVGDRSADYGFAQRLDIPFFLKVDSHNLDLVQSVASDSHGCRLVSSNMLEILSVINSQT